MLRRAFMAAAVGWAAALPLAAWSASGPAWSALYVLALAVYAAGSIVCHQLPERSFHLFGAQLPVCARCTGIYVGGAIAAIASHAASLLGGTGARTTRTNTARAALILAAAPTAATLLFEWITGQMPANWIRAVAGFPMGAAVAWLAVGSA